MFNSNIIIDKPTFFLIVISSPSASGKDTFLKKIKEETNNIVIITRLTTRKPRNGELINTNYQFVEEDFIYNEYKKGRLLFLEENYGGRLYGVYKEDVEKARVDGKIPIIIANVSEGVGQILEFYPDSLCIFITPFCQELNFKWSYFSAKEKKRIEKKIVSRLSFLIKKRGRCDFDINTRIKQGLTDCQKFSDYDHIIFNTYDKNGTKGSIFQKTYTFFKKIILEEIKYRRYLLKLSNYWKYQYKKNNQQVNVWLKKLNLNKDIFRLPQDISLYKLVSQLRNLRKNGLKEKNLQINLFFYKSTAKKLKKVVSLLSYYFAPNLPQIKALSLFHFWENTSRVNIIRDLEAKFDFDPETKILTISEGFFLPEIKIKEIKKMIIKENKNKLTKIAELPCLSRLQTIAQGGFEEKSNRFKRMANLFFHEIKKFGFIFTVKRYANSSDWYCRRLAAETLSVISPFHPQKKEIVQILLELIRDPKIGQVSDPALRGLRRFIDTGYRTKKIKREVIKLLRDPHRAWARKEMLNVLASIGDHACLDKILEELGNSERYANRLAALENLKNFKKSILIYSALIYLSQYDPVIDVRYKSREILKTYKKKEISGHNPSKLLFSSRWIERVYAVNSIISNKAFVDDFFFKSRF